MIDFKTYLVFFSKILIYIEIWPYLYIMRCSFSSEQNEQENLCKTLSQAKRGELRMKGHACKAYPRTYVLYVYMYIHTYNIYKRASFWNDRCYHTQLTFSLYINIRKKNEKKSEWIWPLCFDIELIELTKILEKYYVHRQGFLTKLLIMIPKLPFYKYSIISTFYFILWYNYKHDRHYL